MNPCGVGVITEFPYKLIKVQAVFDVVKYLRIGYPAEDISIQVKSTALTMLRSATTTDGGIELFRSIPRRDVDRDAKVISDRLKDIFSYLLEVRYFLFPRGVVDSLSGGCYAFCAFL